MNRLLHIATLCCCIAAPFATPAFNDPVELDGNAISNGGDDWQNINLGTSQALVSTGVISDAPPATIFWKGGSKDDNDVTQWWYKDGSVPDKDDLRNGYGAAYMVANDQGTEDLVFYFGAERFANTGDAIMGFWFFQDQVGPDGNNRFTGQHTENDLFVIMEYPQGANAEPFVQVMRWVSNGGDVTNNLELLYSSESAKCGTPSDDGTACAITNVNPELAGSANGLWEYQSKSGSANTYPVESFFEGRLNVSKALNNSDLGISDLPCFSSFLIETRSSRSETAQLKDFLGKQFNLCSIAVTKTCAATELTQDNQFKTDYSMMLTNTGIGTIGSAEIITLNDAPGDGQPFSISVGVSDFTNGTDGWNPDETLIYTGSYVSGTNGGSNTVDASVSFGNAQITASQYTTACDAIELSPMLTIAKSCALSLEEQNALVAVRKDYDIRVCNQGDVPLDVNVTDSMDTSLNESYALDFPRQCSQDSDCSSGFSCSDGQFCTDNNGDYEGFFGGSVCQVTTGNYLPGTIPTGENGTLANTATATATSPVVDTGLLGTLGNSATASCTLCPLLQNQTNNN